MKTSVTFLLIRPTREILMQLRDDGKGKSIPYPDMWCFPGGACDPDEEPMETVVREVWEEYNLHIDKNNWLLITTFQHDNMLDFVYACNVMPDMVPVLKEGKDMDWKQLDTIKKLALGWGQHLIIPAIEKYLNLLQLKR